MININEKDSLIMLVDNKTNKFQDKTSEIQWCKLENNCIRVKFYSSNTFYLISLNKIRMYYRKRLININETEVFYRGQPLNDVTEIIDFGVCYKLLYEKKKSVLLKKSELTMIDDITDSLVQRQLRFNYFKELSNQSHIDGDNYLMNQYQRIDPTLKYTVLNYYLSQRNNIIQKYGKLYIYPFGLNLSQKEAVENAFTSNVSFIEGPPGTGKTQTILNIISNAVYQNKTVAVVSNNNAAIYNVRDKLIEYDFGFITALLGNKDNKIDFFKEETDGLRSDLINSWDLDEYKIEYLENQCVLYQQKLPKLYEKENILAKLKIDQINLINEYNHFQNQNKDIIIPNNKIIKKTNEIKKIIKFKIELEHIQAKSRFKIFLLKIKYGLFHKIETEEAIKNLINYLDIKFYKLKIQKNINEMNKIEVFLEKENYSEAKSNYQEISKQLFKIKLKKKYTSIKSRSYTYSNYKNNFKEFIEDYPIILSTTHSLITSANIGYFFDYLIIDEASQTDLLSSVLSLYCAKNAIIVGDSKQLPQIENKYLESVNNKLKKLYNITNDYDYFGNNILSSMIKVFPTAPRVMLKEHYRCHPLIINFCNQKFYNNELIILTNSSLENNPLKIYKTVPGNHARINPSGSGLYNLREVDEIKQVVENAKSNDIGIISPYRKQVEIIKENIQDKSETIEVDTVHKFQGRAKDVVILSTVANDIRNNTSENDFKEDFVSRSDLLNVAVSRAKNQLNLIVSDKIYHSKNNNIADLIKYIKFNSSPDDIQEGSITSVFDILYSDYQYELEKFRKSHYRTRYDSESIALNLIQKVIKEYNNLQVNMHIPLYRIINNYSEFNHSEQKYLRNPWTHVDFLISNYVTKEVVLIIEVDGVSFHEQKKNQLANDKIKDRALLLNNINFIRLKTNQSNERDRIIFALNKAYDIS